MRLKIEGVFVMKFGKFIVSIILAFSLTSVMVRQVLTEVVTVQTGRFSK